MRTPGLFKKRSKGVIINSGYCSIIRLTPRTIGAILEAAYSFYKRGMELLETGNPAQAALLLEKAKTLEPGKVSITEALGRAYFNYGQYISALKNFKESIDKQPTDDFLHFCLAFSYYKLGKKIYASKHIKLALALEPDSERYQKLFVRIKKLKRKEERSVG